MTTLLATFQRTADTLRAAPTPTIAPVIVCVVDTGIPSHVRSKEGERTTCLCAKALHRPERDVELRAEMASSKEQSGNDAHGLLRVVATMAERMAS